MPPPNPPDEPVLLPGPFGVDPKDATPTCEGYNGQACGPMPYAMQGHPNAGWAVDHSGAPGMEHPMTFEDGVLTLKGDSRVYFVQVCARRCPPTSALGYPHSTLVRLAGRAQVQVD